MVFITKIVTSTAKQMLLPKVSDCHKNTVNKLQHSVMNFYRNNKFDLCYYGQVNLLRAKIECI